LPAHHPREDPLVDDVPDLVHPARIRRAALGRAEVEHVLAPGSVLADEIAARVERTELAVEHRLDRVERLEGVATRERLPAHADGVDLVDEDDALAAPLARELLRLAREKADDECVDADERLREAGARDGDKRRVEARCDRLREHRLAGARRAEEEQAALAFAACALERLARLPERH